MQTKTAFFKEAVKNLKSSGSILPSSKFLIKKMLEYIDYSDAKIIIELGPGNGTFTKEILKHLPKNSLLICFEINDEFYNHLKQIEDERFIIINDSAENIISQCNLIGITEVDYIISSLPLTNIPNEISKEIIKNSYSILKEKGSFIQYQYSLTYYKKLKSIFKDNLELDFELRNIPPAFIYRCEKLSISHCKYEY